MGYMREFFLNHWLILIRHQIAARLLHGRNKSTRKTAFFRNLYGLFAHKFHDFHEIPEENP
ncbi:hypothetical protein DOM22_11665 [Bdellovibrio sp. ZAP7]|nr:hypothetical protein DOM22_11665 [Bdellovibrio sp. ZAP7]